MVSASWPLIVVVLLVLLNKRVFPTSRWQNWRMPRIRRVWSVKLCSMLSAAYYTLLRPYSLRHFSFVVAKYYTLDKKLIFRAKNGTISHVTELQ